MAETINVPGIGPTKAAYVYAGGALALGIVGYAWWKNRGASDQPADFVGASPDDFGVGDYDSPLGSTGGNSTGSFDSTDPDAIDTNAKWTSAAVEKLSTYGWDAATVATALGKYLSRQGLTEAQIDIVQAAIAAVGNPPVGGPYPITNALPDTPSTGDVLPAPSGFRFENQGGVSTWRDHLRLDWNPVAGATGYKIREVTGQAGGWGGEIKEVGPVSATMIGGLVHNGSYHVQIATVNAAGTGPWSSTLSTRTKN